MNPSPYAYPGMRGVVVPEHVHLIKVEEVFDRICKKFRVTIEELKSPTRQHRISEARHVIMYFLMVEMHITCMEIGALFNRDHSSVIYAKEKITHWVATQAAYRDLIKEVKYDCYLIIGKESDTDTKSGHFERPPAEYSNNGFIAVTKKYAS